MKKLYRPWSYLSGLWYQSTMMLTKRNCELKVVSRVSEIPELFDYGNKYIKDPLGGNFDYLAHPSLLEKRLESGDKFGDCDDHAIYYACKLKKSGLAEKAWFAYYTMCDPTGSGISSHAVCVYESGGQSYWADYRNPHKMSGRWDFATQSAQIYDKKPIAACMFEVDLRPCDDTPIFVNKKVKVDYE